MGHGRERAAGLGTAARCLCSAPLSLQSPLPAFYCPAPVVPAAYVLLP